MTSKTEIKDIIKLVDRYSKCPTCGNQNTKEDFITEYSCRYCLTEKPSQKMLKMWRKTLHNALARMDVKKLDATRNLLDYTALDLKLCLESKFTKGMSWDNYGEWHIDHIIPVSCFKKDTPQTIVNSLDNLRPIWATTRTIDGVLYIGNLNRSKGLNGANIGDEIYSMNKKFLKYLR